MEITNYSLCKLTLPERTLGDSQTGRFRTSELDYGYLTLETNTGDQGYGFDVVNFRTPADLSEEGLRGRLRPLGEELLGKSPFSLLNRQTRHRGGVYDYHASGSYGQGIERMIDYALWDLCGKHLGMPIYELMGGEDRRVPVYASGLSYPNDAENTRRVYESFAEVGAFEAAKVKVGFPTVKEDLDRLGVVLDVLGEDTTLLVDANEAWTPKETVTRATAYRDAGFDIYWIEDPVFRGDVDGIKRVVENTPHTNITMGDYVRLEGKRTFLERGACDIINVHGMSPARDVATIAGTYGVPVGVGTDHGADIASVHVGAALPEVPYMEFGKHRFWELADEPFAINDGYAVAPDQPGHGIELSQDVLTEYRNQD